MTLMCNSDGLCPGAGFSRHILLLAVPVAVLLSGCSEKQEREASTTMVNAPLPVAMPPAIVASHTYRCADGEVFYIDFMHDGTTINVRRWPSDPALRLTAPSQGLAYVGDGMNLTVSGKEVRVDEPKKTSRTCKRA